VVVVGGDVPAELPATTAWKGFLSASPSFLKPKDEEAGAALGAGGALAGMSLRGGGLRAEAEVAVVEGAASGLLLVGAAGVGAGREMEVGAAICEQRRQMLGQSQGVNG
jgi:hypothetical protein